MEELGFESDGSLADRRRSAIAALREERDCAHREFFLNSRAEQNGGGIESIARLLAACTGCRNCRVACPVCYCRECIFDGDVFDYETRQLLRRADRKGALRSPEILSFTI